MSITTSCRREGSVVAHGKGYLASHRLTTPASSAAGVFSCRSIFKVLKAFFSPRGRVWGNMGETVPEVFSSCSSRKLTRQSTKAVYVGRSFSREHTDVRETAVAD
jgi:hypothetical protein